jgi:EAL domain-containing protein (putative c-di-GMP-specific phosphodiesterase class I)
MDDFGTGYSSLSCLHRFPFDVLKIDRAFVMDLESRPDYSAIIGAIISMARHLSLKVTAEGVETEDQLHKIIALDCDFAQGYLFSKPVDAKTATAMVAANPVWQVRERRPQKIMANELPLAVDRP